MTCHKTRRTQHAKEETLFNSKVRDIDYRQIGMVATINPEGEDEPDQVIGTLEAIERHQDELVLVIGGQAYSMGSGEQKVEFIFDGSMRNIHAMWNALGELQSALGLSADSRTRAAA